jgi:NTP pyrophosphatase (non-canonical NTP hydrolase)
MSIMEQLLNLGCEFSDVWQQAKDNHETYSHMGDEESDIRFLALGLAGEAGELANFVKKRWRDGDSHESDITAEIADVCAYAFMLAQKFGLTPRGLVREIARKQQVFIDKMKAKEAA